METSKEDKGEQKNKNYKGVEKKDRVPRSENVNSWVYKYHHNERPTHDYVTITSDSVIPPMPAKDEILRQPNKDALDAKLKQMDD